MNLETVWGIGDAVYIISFGEIRKPGKPCKSCGVVRYATWTTWRALEGIIDEIKVTKGGLLYGVSVSVDGSRIVEPWQIFFEKKTAEEACRKRNEDPEEVLHG